MPTTPDEKKKILLFEKLREFFTPDPVAEVAPVATVEMTEATLKDGTKVKISGGLAQGSKITVVNADGSEMPAPNGEHILDDGTTITVTDGIIDSVVPAEAAADPAEVGMNEEFTALKASYEDLKAEYKKLLESNESKFKEVDSLKAEFAKIKEAQKATYDVVEAIAGLPAETSTEVKANQNFKKENRLEAIASAMAEIHSKQN